MQDKLITRNEFKQRLAELCVQSGLTSLPHKPRDRHILMKSMVHTLNATQKYAEKEINDKLKFWLKNIGHSIDIDHVTLRRQLVELGYLERNRDGSSYWVATSGPGQTMFESDVEEVDPYEIVRVSRELVEQKKRDYLQKHSEQYN